MQGEPHAAVRDAPIARGAPASTPSDTMWEWGETPWRLIMAALTAFVLVAVGAGIYVARADAPLSGALTMSNARAAAASIVLVRGDLPKGFTETESKAHGPADDPMAIPGGCTPVSGQPWDGSAETIFYSPSKNENVISSVWIMPNAKTARASVREVDAANFGPACLEPTYDSIFKRNLSLTPEPAACGTLEWRYSQIDRYKGRVFLWRYLATFDCSVSSNTSNSYTIEDILFVNHGPIFLQINFTSANPSDSQENHLLALMQNRADRFTTGPVTR
jgi:hypothetical protein